MKTQTRKKIFLYGEHYSTKQKHGILSAAEALKRAGHKVVTIVDEEFTGHTTFNQVIDAIRACDVVALMQSNYMYNTYTDEVVKAAEANGKEYMKYDYYLKQERYPRTKLGAFWMDVKIWAQLTDNQNMIMV